MGVFKGFFSEARDSQDFTLAEYADLLRIAKKKYEFVTYASIDLSKRFVLWRHDVDYSLNRALGLAKIEAEESVSSTFFLNLHSDFYNIFEKSQNQLIQKIIKAGHSVGLHFDASFYDVRSEEELDLLISRESVLLSNYLGVEVTAFSFHNPTEFLLTCESDQYGGIINCYSSTFKKMIPYCSDSNGYWRHRRLRDVLESGSDSCLHVLTHPAWWQEEVMTPRERIYRAVDGRAIAVMEGYDLALKEDGRDNQTDLGAEFEIIYKALGSKARGLDFRWMRGEYASVFVDLWRLFESKLFDICKIYLCRETGISLHDSALLLRSELFNVRVHYVLSALLEVSWVDLAGVEEADYRSWREKRDHLVRGSCLLKKSQLRQGVKFLVLVMGNLLSVAEEYSSKAFFVSRDVICLEEWLYAKFLWLRIDESELRSLVESHPLFLR